MNSKTKYCYTYYVSGSEGRKALLVSKAGLVTGVLVTKSVGLDVFTFQVEL
jgi:hypothetical protein